MDFDPSGVTMSGVTVSGVTTTWCRRSAEPWQRWKLGQEQPMGTDQRIPKSQVGSDLKNHLVQPFLAKEHRRGAG